jgi:APA family basic amino acid/polyamine antiporter
LRSDAALIRAVGFWALAASVVNVIVGGGIFKFPQALDQAVGAAAPIALVLGALAILPAALCFSAAGSRVTATGGPYTYAEAAFGPFAGFLGGVLMWICNVSSSAGVATALADTAAGAGKDPGSDDARRVLCWPCTAC